MVQLCEGILFHPAETLEVICVVIFVCTCDVYRCCPQVIKLTWLLLLLPPLQRGNERGSVTGSNRKKREKRKERGSSERGNGRGSGKCENASGRELMNTSVEVRVFFSYHYFYQSGCSSKWQIRHLLIHIRLSSLIVSGAIKSVLKRRITNHKLPFLYYLLYSHF